MEEKYQQTLRQEAEIRRQGYQLVKLWQCQFAEGGTIDPVEEPLEPRQAFFGGRTNVVKLVIG